MPVVHTLVIGGTQFIGRHTVEELLRRGHEVTIFHRGRSPSPFGGRVREVLGDRMRDRDVRALFSNGAFDAVIDLVYVWGLGTGPSQAASILEAAGENLKRYVFLSSCGVYKPGGRPPATENSPRSATLGQYSADKIATEDFLLDAHRRGLISVSIVRPPHVYGPFNNVPRESWFWDRIVANRPVLVPGKGRTLTHLAAVWDVAWSLVECLENPAARGEIFNVANANPISQTDLVDLLGAAANLEVEKVFVPREQIQARGGSAFSAPLYFAVALDAEIDLVVDVSKAVHTLGFRPTDPFKGLQRTFAWYMENDRARSPTFSFDKALLGR